MFLLLVCRLLSHAHFFPFIYVSSHTFSKGLSPLHFAARTCRHPLLADSLIHGFQKAKLAMQLGMAEIFESVRDAAQKLLECDRVTLFLADPADSTLWSVVADKSLPIKLPWDQGMVGQCYNSCDVHVISDVQNHHNFDKSWDQKSGYVTKNMLMAPLINELDTNEANRSADAEASTKANAVYGVIQCINKLSRNYDASRTVQVWLYCCWWKCGVVVLLLSWCCLMVFSFFFFFLFPPPSFSFFFFSCF